MVIAEGDAGAWGYDAGEAKGRGGVNAEGFFYHVIEAGRGG